MDSFKTFIIGLGNIGMLYDYKHENNSLILTHAKAVSNHNNFELVGATDKDLSRCKKFKILYEGKIFESIKDGIENTNPDLIIVSSSTESHLEIIREISNYYSPKAILCEKPLAYELNEAEEIIDICKKISTNLYVNYMRRCDPSTIEIQEKINKKEIKLPIKGNCWYSKGLYNNCSHFINLLEFWLGDVKNINLISVENNNSKFDFNLDFICEFEKGRIFFQSSPNLEFTYNFIEIISPNGKLTYNEGGKYITWQAVIGDLNFKNNKILNPKKILSIQKWIFIKKTF